MDHRGILSPVCFSRIGYLGCAMPSVQTHESHTLGRHHRSLAAWLEIGGGQGPEFELGINGFCSNCLTSSFLICLLTLIWSDSVVSTQ